LMATRLVIVDCAQMSNPSAGSIDQLARLFLVTRRSGCDCRLANASDELLDLIGFCGLSSALRVEPGRKPPQGEEPGGVEEERELGDTPI
jgi:hypothetical protein